VERSDYYILEQILEGKFIKPVYQPIVSLTDGQIFGYEALSRITNETLQMNIEHMFRVADRINKSWELETLCRTKALEHAIYIGKDKKLFLNVNSNIVYDDEFKKGFTKNRLNEYGLDTNNIIFEISEHISILDNDAFLGSISHYKNQNYGIAIDDVGAGYSGLNTIASIKPNLIKLDMNLVRDIDKDETKQALCRAMVDFGKNTGIKLIAEGIETEEELKTLIKLEADYGQGYYLGIPQETFEDITDDKIQKIKIQKEKSSLINSANSVYPIIGYLAKPGYTFSPTEKAESIYETLRLNPNITDFVIIQNSYASGFMTRTDLNEMFSGRYGYSINSKKYIQQIMRTDFLRVNYSMPVDQVSRLAMQRPFEQLYNPIVIEKEDNYLGVVTIKNLLDTYTKVEVDIAKQTNPLTGLPGNLVIEKNILNRIFREDPYCIAYYDIDNFKAYNDAYGFDNGDKMLMLLAETLRACALNNEYVGHIGGDDFIVICDYQDGEKYCQTVIDCFSSKITSLYRDEDIKNGYIISKNRNGVTEKFPIASLSVAGISNRTNAYQNIGDFSRDIAQLKKKCKRQSGNYMEIL
jgi:diguanylate cyclase (GGDEF)-like protein